MAAGSLGLWVRQAQTERQPCAVVGEVVSLGTNPSPKPKSTPKQDQDQDQRPKTQDPSPEVRMYFALGIPSRATSYMGPPVRVFRYLRHSRVERRDRPGARALSLAVGARWLNHPPPNPPNPGLGPILPFPSVSPSRNRLPPPRLVSRLRLFLTPPRLPSFSHLHPPIAASTRAP